MSKLIATRPILFLNRQYAAGDELPSNQLGMAQAWLDAGSAKWEEPPAGEPENPPGNPGDSGEPEGDKEPDDPATAPPAGEPENPPETPAPKKPKGAAHK